MGDEEVAALLPTMAARANPQLWYASMAPLVGSLVLRRLCRRGRAGQSPGLAYFEWCAGLPDDELAELSAEEKRARLFGLLDDRQAWADANPGLGIRISEEFVSREREAMDDEDFARERLGIWFDEEDERLFSETTWDLVCTPDAHPSGEDLTMALDVNPERTAAAIIAVAGGELEVIEHRNGIGWVVDRAKALDAKWEPIWAVDGSPSAPVASLLPELRDAELEIVEVAGDDLAAACGKFYDDVVEQRITIRRHVSLDTAVGGVQKRKVGAGGGWAWARQGDVDISPLMAATVAWWVDGGDSDPAIY